MNHKLVLSDHIQRNQNLLSAVIDDEMVLLDHEKGSYYGLNATATDIWNLLSEPRTVSALCEELIKHYEVEEVQCHEEVLTHLTILLEQKVVVICE